MNIDQFIKPGFLIGLIVLGIFAGRFLRRHSKDPYSRFNLVDLLLGDDGKPSKAAIIMYGAFTVSSWVLIFVTLNRPDEIGALYLAYSAVWATPAVTALIVNAWKSQPAPTNVSVRNVEGNLNVPDKPAVPPADGAS